MARPKAFLPNGVTTLTNAELFDHQGGKGLVADAWRQDPVYVIGTGAKPNNCIDLVVRVLAEMKLPINPATQELFDNSQEYYTHYSKRLVERIQDVCSAEQWPSRDKPETVIFQLRVFDVVEDPEHPRLISEKTDEKSRRSSSIREMYRTICENSTS